jgi:SAM-dependent methyltransferase
MGTALEHVACNLCGADETRVRFPSTLRDDAVPRPRAWESFRCTHPGYGRHHRIVTCVRCGLRYADPRPSGAEIRGSYSEVEDPLYLEELEARRLTFERHLDGLERFRRPPGSLLDVGACTGAFVDVARRRGWDAAGLEPSSWAVSRAVAQGLRVSQGFLEDHSFPEGSWDVVTFWDVIEHLTDPALALERSFRLLRPGGLLVVHTMDSDSPLARLTGPRWPWLMEMHLYYYSRRTLEAALRRAGFEVLRTVAQGRYLRLGYFASRLGALLGPATGRVSSGLLRALRLTQHPISINLGDLVTSFALKPTASRRSDDDVEPSQRDRASGREQIEPHGVPAGRH